MLVTRPEPDASDTAQRLSALGISPVVAPLLRYEVLETSLPEARGFAALAVTSANALRALAARGAVARFAHLPVHAVGDRTAEAARALGFANSYSAGGSFTDLVAQLAHASVSGPIFYPSGREVSGDLARSLAPFGKMVITAAVYAMAEVDEVPEAIARDAAEGRIAAALLYSRRSAEALVKVLGPSLDRRARSRLGMLCISEAVAAPLIDAHFVRIGLADHPSEDAMMSLALSFAREHTPDDQRDKDWIDG